MRIVFFYNLIKNLKKVVPLGTLLILTILSAIPISVLGSSAICPFFNFVGVFYWSIYRPDRLPIFGLVGIGIIGDLLLGTVVGFTSILFLILFALTIPLRNLLVTKSFYFIWLGFTLVCALVCFGAWVIVSVISGQLSEIVGITMQLGMTIASFPVLLWILTGLQRGLME